MTIGKAPPQLHILGAGSIGLLFASYMRLTTKPYPVRMLLRSRHRHKIKQYSKPILSINLPPGRNSPSQHVKTDWILSSRILQANRCRRGVENLSGIQSIFGSPYESNKEEAILDEKARDEDGYILCALTSSHVTGEGRREMTKIVDIPAEIIQEKGATSPEADGDAIQNLLLCTKAPDAAEALDSVKHRLDPDGSNIIIMSNGALAVLEDVKHILSTSNNNVLDEKTGARNVRIYMASTTHGAYQRSDEGIRQLEYKLAEDTYCYDVVHAGMGSVFIENCPSLQFVQKEGIRNTKSQKEQRLIHTLNEIWLDVGLSPTLISKEQMNVLNWKKLAANCAINPLTALRKCTNGKLLSFSKLSSFIPSANSGNHMSESRKELHYEDPNILYQLIREVSDVAIAEIKAAAATNKIDTGVDADTMKPPLSELSTVVDQFRYEELVSFVESVIQDTAQNKSSMLQDVIARRYPTEIQYLNGYAVRVGREQHNLCMNVNEYICQEIQRLTRNFV